MAAQNETKGNISERRAAIARDIRRAVADVLLDDGVSLHGGWLVDDEYYPSVEQLAAARALDTDIDWTEVSPSVINKLSDAIPFLDARGRHYYLPAFRAFALDPPEYDTGGAEESVVQTLSHLDSYRHEFDSYINAQKAVIARFLRCMIDEQDAFFPTKESVERWADRCEDEFTENGVEIAFNEYWGRFVCGSP